MLKGATGTGKTFVLANLIARTNRPTLIMVPNKVLAFCWACTALLLDCIVTALLLHCHCTVTALHCTVLHCTGTVLYYTVLHCTGLLLSLH